MDWTTYYAQGMELLFLGIGSYLDIKSRELPMLFFIVFGAAGIFYNQIYHYQSISSMVAGGCIGVLFLLISWLTKEEIGYGDGLGIIVLGVMEGGAGILPILFAAFFLSGMYGLWKMIGLKDGRETAIPFFPFLFIGLIGGIFL